MASVSALPLWEFQFDGSFKSSKTCRSGAGAVLWYTPAGSSRRERVWSGSEPLQAASNNEAEYHALILCLETALRFHLPHIVITGDSQLVIDQFNNQAQCSARNLKPLRRRALVVASNIRSIHVSHVYREHNTVADSLANDGDKGKKQDLFGRGWSLARIQNLAINCPAPNIQVLPFLTRPNKRLQDEDEDDEDVQDSEADDPTEYNDEIRVISSTLPTSSPRSTAQIPPAQQPIPLPEEAAHGNQDEDQDEDEDEVEAIDARIITAVLSEPSLPTAPYLTRDEDEDEDEDNLSGSEATGPEEDDNVSGPDEAAPIAPPHPDEDSHSSLSEDEDSRDSGESQPSAAKVSCPCPGCKTACKQREGIRKHINAKHLDEDITILNSNCSPDVLPFTRCSTCRYVFNGAVGLKIHQGRRSSCFVAPINTTVSTTAEDEALLANTAANTAAAMDVLSAVGGVPPATSAVPAVPRSCPPLDTVTGLHDIVALFRRPLENIRKTGLKLIARLTIKLMPLMHSSSDTSPLIPAQNAAAFLLLPGLLRVAYDLKRKPLDILHQALAAPVCSAYILRTAQDYIRAGLVSPTEYEPTPTNRNKRVRKIQELTINQRDGLAMSVAEELHALGSQPSPTLRLSEEEQRCKLSELHPAPSECDILPARTAPRTPIPSVWRIYFDTSGLDYSIRRLSTATKGGWTGWTNKLIQKMTLYCNMQDVLSPVICSFFNTWVDGSLPKCVANLFSVARGVLIPKADGNSVRPLGIGEAWYRLFGRHVLTCISRSDVQDRLQPLQMGGGAKSGTEIVARVCQLSLDCDQGGANDAICIGSLDIKNAFNSLRRKHILNGILANCPPLEPIFRLLYDSPTDVRLSDGSLACRSSSGVRQGDPLSNLLFSLGFLAPLQDIQTALAAVQGVPPQDALGHVIAYADDVNFSCPTNCVNAFGTEIVSILERYDIPLAIEKCSIFGRGVGNISPPPPFPIAQRGLRRVVGVPVGPLPFRVESLQDALTTMVAPLPTVTRLPAQSAFILTTRCINSRACYLARIVETDGDNTSQASFDSHIDDALLTIADCPLSHRPKLHTIRTLPQRYGGLGIQNIGGLHGQLGQNASRLLTRHFLQDHKLSKLFDQSTRSWKASPLLDGDSSIDGVPADPVALPCRARDVARDQRQAAASALHSQLIEDKLFADAALFLSCQTPDSSRWLLFRGTLHGTFRMNSDVYRRALQRRCLSPLTPLQRADLLKPCNCRASPSVRAHSTHREDCASNQYHYEGRHDTVITLLCTYLKTVHPDALIIRETPLNSTAQPPRMDIQLKRGARTINIDVTLTNPACVTNINRKTYIKTDAASDSRARYKTRKYRHHLDAMEQDDGPQDFVPFVIETTGRLGKDALRFLKEHRNELNPRPLTNLLDSISACIAMYNSLMATNAQRRLEKDEELAVHDL